MLILGLIVLVIGWLTGIGLLTTIGAILAVVGVVLLVVGGTGRAIGGRRYWY
jgi:hypothetical protein